MKRLLLSIVLLLMASAAVFAQPRRVFIEEFTGAWCGWCPRGQVAINQLDAHYPGMVVPISVHEGDPMANAQADSITGGSGFPSAAAFPGYPSGWLTRITNGVNSSTGQPNGTWSSDPFFWVDSVNYATGIVDQMLTQQPKATVSLSDISMDMSTLTVSAKVTAKFLQSMSGDFRMNVIVVEDSVVGPANSTYDQHNYYYQNSDYPKSPYYNSGSGAVKNGIIASFVHNHVYRGSIAGVHSSPSGIPSAVSPGQEYSKTFSFKLPFTVTNPNHVKLVAIVHQFSATDATKNEVYDAEEKPLSTTPIKIVSADYTFNPEAGFNPESNATYVSALANGDSSQTISFFNSGAADATLSVAVDPSTLPSGWTYSVNPQTVTVPGFSSASTILTIHAPSQANFVVAKLLVSPTAPGAWGATSVYPVYALSSSTKEVLLWSTYPEYATINGMPAAYAQDFAALPLNQDVMSNYPISDMDLAIFATPLIDNNNSYFNFPNPLAVIQPMLQNGKKVFLTSDLGLFYGFDPTSPYPAAQSEDGTSFLQDTLGLSFVTTTSYYNSTNGQYSSFKATATNDPISKGLTSTLNQSGAVYPQQLATFFSVDPTKSTPLFYLNSSTALDAGIRYQNDAGGKMVFLAFRLNAIASQTTANKIATNSINWLMAPNGSVAQPKMTTEGMFATANPFVGHTDIRYTPKSDEANVTFAAYDLLGHEVATMPAKMMNGAYTTTFDASGLASGTYTIVATTSKGAHQIRVVAE